MHELLTPHQVHSLQAVDLRIAFINHGRPASTADGISLLHGPAFIHVADTDYGATQQLLSDMSQGDVSAREKMYGLGDDVPDNSSILRTVRSAVDASPYATHNPLSSIADDQVHLAQPLTTANTPPMVPAFAEALQVCRDLRILSPFHYVDGLAAMNGVRRALADSPAEQLEGEQLSVQQRNKDMLKGLGGLAVEMLADARETDRRLKLAFTAGLGHRGLRQLLDCHRIPYRSCVVRTPWAITARHWATTLTVGLVSPESIRDRMGKQAARPWLQNARTYSDRNK